MHELFENDVCFAKRIDPGLIRLFGRLPRTPYGVIAVPAYAELAAAYEAL